MPSKSKKNQAQQISDLVKRHKEYANSFKLVDRGNHTQGTFMYRYKWNSKSLLPLVEVKRRIDKHLEQTTMRIIETMLE